MNTVIALICGLILLGFCARFLFAVLATGREKFVPGHWMGIHAKELMASPQAWDAGHKAARPMFTIGAILSAIDAFAVVGMTGNLGLRHVFTVGGGSLILLIILWQVGRNAAIRAAKNTSAHKDL